MLGPAAGAARAGNDDGEIPFDEPGYFFVLDDTDGDLGLHALIEGKALVRRKPGDKVALTPVMPAPPEPTVNGKPMAVQCDNEMPGFDAPMVRPPVTIAWPAVTQSHPKPVDGGAGVWPPVPVTIVNYEVVVEIDDTPFKVSTILPPSQTSYVVPAEILALGDQFKFEVLARDESFNQTATESCFELK